MCFPLRSIRNQRWKYILNLHPEYRYQTHVTEKPGDTGYWPSWMEQAKIDEHAKRIVDRYITRPAAELYDLENDPLEQNNLVDVAESRDVKAQLHEQLTTWMNQTGDQQPVLGRAKAQALDQDAQHHSDSD